MATNATRKKITAIGVLHSTKAVGSLQSFRKAIARMKIGQQKIGVEKIVDPVPRHDSMRRNPAYRYFLGQQKIAKRARVELEEIEDPAAYRMRVGLQESMQAFAHDMKTGGKRKLRIGKHTYGSFTHAEMCELEVAIDYFRSRMMENEAKKKGIKIIFVGVPHDRHIRTKGNKSSDKQTYAKHKTLISKIYKDLQRS